jgi:hypothetical protein
MFRKERATFISPKLFLKMEGIYSSKKLVLTDKATYKNAQIVQPQSDHMRLYLSLYQHIITLTPPGLSLYQHIITLTLPGLSLYQHSITLTTPGQ